MGKWEDEQQNSKQTTEGLNCPKVYTDKNTHM